MNTTPPDSEVNSTAPEEIATEVISNPVPVPRNQFAKVEEPKIKQFTGRATQKEYDRITAAINARKREGSTYDIVRLCLDMLDYIEDDFLQTFKTK